MTRVHDMGGRFGDGPVVPEPQGIARFKAEWQARALALTLASGALGKWNIDTSRHARECLSPADYARFSYYEKWIAALADLLVETGLLEAGDLRDAGSGASLPLIDAALKSDQVAAVLAKGGAYDRPGDVPVAFAVGQAVQTVRPSANRLIDGGHTRLPSYAAGARGRILRCHGAHVFPDSNAHLAGESPQPLYSVIFPAGELWSAPENPKDEVVLDLWQPYLEPA